MKPNLPFGTLIEHRGAISFNYQEPYLTNYTNLIVKQFIGIGETTGDGILKIYPNPGSGVFIVKVPEINDKVSIKVFDAIGTMVLEEIHLGNSSEVLELNLSDQADGLYIVRIQSKSRSLQGKVILMR